MFTMAETTSRALPLWRWCSEIQYVRAGNTANSVSKVAETEYGSNSGLPQTQTSVRDGSYILYYNRNDSGWKAIFKDLLEKFRLEAEK